MRHASRFALIGLGIAGVVALASALYLRESHQAVERITKPVDLSAPDLFPEKTLAYTEMFGWDQSYAHAEAWWKKFEETAAYHALRKSWDGEKLGLPPHVVEMIDRADRELSRAEEKFGYRPTTRQFWEAFGRHVAIGLLPAPAGERPRLLLATRLPDSAPAALQSQLSKAGGVKPTDPPMHHGFPMFQEPVAAESGITAYYGVGRGYFFISESLPELKNALERLAASTDGKNPRKPTGTLAGDPALTRVRPPAGKAESAVLYLRRDLKLADWQPELGIVDEFIRHAFILAPKDEAVAFSLPDGPDGEVRCSFDAATPRSWTKSLPPGLVLLEASLPTPPGEVRRHREKENADFFEKPIWKELDAFLSDSKRIKAFLDEALPEGERPPDDLIARLPNDIRFLGAALKEAAADAVNYPDPQFAIASKVYPGTDGAFVTQTAFGLDVDPMAVFVLAGALDFVRTKWPEWLAREERPGVLAWSIDMKRAMKELGEHSSPQEMDIYEKFVAHLAPSILLSGRRVIFVLGAELSKEIAAAQAGGASFEDDPLYAEARGQVRPGYSYVSWDRPAERLRATWPVWLEWFEEQMSMHMPADEGNEILRAGLKAVRKAIGWAKPHRAILAASYLDAARPSETAELIDAESEKKTPSLVPPDAPARSLDFLPADAWIYLMQRLELRPSWDSLKETFLEALPGGKEREDLELSGEAKVIVDRIVEGLIRNLKGEVGFAVIKPTPKPEEMGPPGPAVFLARMPAFVAFAEFEKPVEAFQAVRMLMEKLHEAIKGEFAEDPEEEFRTEFKVGMVGEYRAASIDFVIPTPEEPVVVSICVVERGGFLFFTTSGEVVRRLGSAKERDADSLYARLAKALPPGAAPEKVSALGLWNADTLVAQVRLYLELLLPAAPGLTLRGYPEGPPMERVQAHTEGWTRWMDLVLDLFRTRSWSVSSTSRTGAVIKSATIVAPERN